MSDPRFLRSKSLRAALWIAADGKCQDPAKAPSREQVVDALKQVPRERKAIDAKVREVLGQKRDRVAELVRAYRRLSPAEQRRFEKEISR